MDTLDTAVEPAVDGGNVSSEPIVCAVCRTGAARYRCPSCLMRSCSVECVRQHKEASGCSGKADPTKFVPLAKFDETQLLRDYAFLVDTEKDMRREKRARADDGSEGPARKAKHQALPSHLAKLVRVAAQHSVTLRIMPDTFTRRKSNKTHCSRDALFWTVEVVAADGARSLVHKNSAQSILRSVLDKAGHTDAAQCYLSVFGQPANDPLYFALDAAADTLQSALAGTTVVEYPTFQLAAPPPQQIVTREQLAARAPPTEVLTMTTPAASHAVPPPPPVDAEATQATANAGDLVVDIGARLMTLDDGE